MTGGAERQLAERWGVQLEAMVVDGDLRAHLDANPAVTGMLALAPVEGGALIHAVVRPGLADERRESFAAWVDDKLDRYFEHGPEPDGWQPRTSDGGWQLWAREVQLPPL